MVVAGEVLVFADGGGHVLVAVGASAARHLGRVDRVHYGTYQ